MSKSVFFASDFHLGLDTHETSQQRELRIISWMDSILDKCEQLFLLGDLFDYWFEYDTVVPKGYFRFFAKISEFTARGIPVHVFTGNHDMWLFDYMEKELRVIMYRKVLEIYINDFKFVLGHGDGLGPGDHGYKFIKKVFSSRINQWLYAKIHPDWGIKLMRYFSKKSRDSQEHNNQFLGKEKEWLVQYCESYLNTNKADFFIFGHRHFPIDYTLSNNHSRYINAGDWIDHNSYVEFNGSTIELKYYNT